MTRLFTLLLLSISIFSQTSHAQEPEWETERKKKEVFANMLDSLFLENKYDLIIETCSQSGSSFNLACTYNLIGTYYFLGDSLKSWELLNKRIATGMAYADFDAYSFNILLAEDYTAYRKFLRESTAKQYILNLVDSLYRTEPVSDKGNGLELVHLLIEDQWVRNTSSLYNHFKPERRHLLPSQMDSLQAIQAQRDHSTKVFEFYKQHNKVFSKAEVGRAYYGQLILFFHEWDLSRRDFYHELMKQGVKNGAMDIENQMNFEIGTLYIKMGVDDFFKHREEIQEEYRKKYAKPDFRIRMM